MTESTRPKRVVIVDADNPLQEISGEFFWREDHDLIVADARDAAYRDGFNQGYESARRTAPTTIVVRGRGRRTVARFVITALLILALVAFVADVLLPALGRFV